MAFYRASLALCALGAITLSACGSSSSSESGAAKASSSGASSGTGSSPLDAARTFVAPFLKPATSINISAALPQAPPQHKKVFWLEGSIADIQTITKGFRPAVAALGWELHVLTYDPSNPQQANSVMQQAVDQGADFISISGLPSAAFQQALGNANAKGIPVFDAFSTNDVQGKGNGIYTEVGGPAQVQLFGKIVADYEATDSNGSAHVVFFNIPDFPILVTLQKAAQAELQSSCPSCTFDVQNVTINDLTSGALPQIVASYLQSHPDTTYAHFAIGAMATGVSKTLATAGLGSKVKIVGSDAALANLQGLLDGTENAWAGLPRQMSAWYLVDAMARFSEGMDLTVDQKALIPTQLFTKATAPNPPAEYDGPSDYPAQFRALWHVSG